MQLHIRHETQYSYTEPVKRSVQNLRLTPRQELTQRALNWSISAPGRQHAQQDAHGNVVHLLTIDQPHREIKVVVQGIVETDDAHCARLLEQGSLSPLTYLAATSLTRPNDAIVEFAQAFKPNGHGDDETLLRLAGAICERIEYQPGVTDVRESAAQAFDRRKGVCQDHAHVFIAAARSIGIPARYVSGYVFTGKHDQVASHAWVDAWLGPSRGWLGIDVTHRALIGGHHCRLAVGRDYLEACPIRGVRRGGGEEAMEVAVSISASAQQQ
jgi:transglutaminase-like putative cysteine protease